MEYNLFEKLKRAYELSTQNNNLFKKCIENTTWDDTFRADGEIYFLKNGFTLTVESLDPFKQAWKPTVIFSDRSTVGF